MRQMTLKVDTLSRIKKDIFLLGFTSSYLAKRARPGQFLHIKVDSPDVLLRRAFSIHRVERNKVFVLFKIRGQATRALSYYKKGCLLDIIGPLGNGFELSGINDKQRTHILVAGGIGVAPLVFLAEKLKSHQSPAARADGVTSHKIVALLGGRTKDDVAGKEILRKLGCEVLVSTDDGSLGYKGKVTDLLKKTLSTMDYGPSTIYACGPKDMFTAIAGLIKNRPRIKAQVSFEQFMGCGTGVCQACVIKTKQGYKKVCKDGPVFDLKDI